MQKLLAENGININHIGPAHAHMVHPPIQQNTITLGPTFSLLVYALQSRKSCGEIGEEKEYSSFNI